MLRPGKAALLFSVMCAGISASAAEFKSGEVIVKYKSGLLRSRSNMNSLYSMAGVDGVKRYSGLKTAGIMQGIEHLFLKDGVRVEDALSALRKDASVEYAQPNYILHALPIEIGNTALAAKPAGTPCLFPGIPYPPGCDSNGSDPSEPSTGRPALSPVPADVIPAVADPDLGKAYGLQKISAPAAWKKFKGTKDFIVADIDTGIDYNHEDLAFNVWRNPHPTDKSDVVGYDFIHNDGLPFDDNMHGTHTAGTIGAVGGNGVGVSGVSQRVSLMALKFLSGEGSGTTSDAIRAIDYAIANGAKVLSNSWGGKGDSDNQALKDAVSRAEQKGVLFVAAAGNDSSDNDGSDPSYPAAFDNPNMITVAATDENDGMAYFSNYGKTTTHLAAPGANIYSTAPGNKYQSLSGTSMACPHVAGAAALLWSMHSDWDYKKVKSVLMKSVDRLSSLEGKTVTGGRINLAKALQSEE